MIRRFLSRLVTPAGIHPDLTLPTVVTSTEERLTFTPKASANCSSVDIHPDLDWDFALGEASAVASQQPDPDVLDLALSLEELQQEENTVSETREKPNSFALMSKGQHLDTDWSLELAWAGAAGTTGFTEAAGSGWDVFDFDIADLSPDPEALAEEVPPPSETANARSRRLDGAAANLVLSLGAFRSSDRRALYRRFRTIVEEFQHPASHAALHRMLAQGASLEEIEEAAHLRCLWRDQPWLWAEKRHTLAAWSVRRKPSQRLAFGWPTAIRLVREFGLVEAECSMVEDWFDTWATLERTKATCPIEEMAFFTYAGFLRQLTPDLLLETIEGVVANAADKCLNRAIHSGL